MMLASTTVWPSSTRTGMPPERPEGRELGRHPLVVRREEAEVE